MLHSGVETQTILGTALCPQPSRRLKAAEQCRGDLHHRSNTDPPGLGRDRRRHQRCCLHLLGSRLSPP